MTNGGDHRDLPEPIRIPPGPRGSVSGVARALPGRWKQRRGGLTLYRHRYSCPEAAMLLDENDKETSPGRCSYPRREMQGRRAAEKPRCVVFVFVKAPVPGRVKTRLASALGNIGAARLYRSLARRIVQRVGTGEYRTVVYFDPPGAERDIREWLGAEREYRPQPGGNLGERLRRAFAVGFREADCVAVVGTDIPELDARVVVRAFDLVSGPGSADVVFGPALDGGYYLLALDRPAPELFEGIAWSTGTVLAESIRRAKDLGLNVRLLDPLADIDREEDLTGELSAELLLDSPDPSQDRDDPSEQDDPSERIGDEDVPEMAHLQPGRLGHLGDEAARRQPDERGDTQCG